MRTLVALTLLSLFTVRAGVAPAQARGWRGIVPLHSTRADVERILGPPSQKISEYSVFYRTAKETVTIQYAQGLTCGIGEKYSRWRVPRNTVESFLVTPLKGIPLSEIRIDESKYEKRSGGHRLEDVHYINEQDGESLRVFMGEVRDISYFPGALDERLLCPGLSKPTAVKCNGNKRGQAFRAQTGVMPSSPSL